MDYEKTALALQQYPGRVGTSQARMYEWEDAREMGKMQAEERKATMTMTTCKKRPDARGLRCKGRKNQNTKSAKETKVDEACRTTEETMGLKDEEGTCRRGERRMLPYILWNEPRKPVSGLEMDDGS